MDRDEIVTRECISSLVNATDTHLCTFMTLPAKVIKCPERMHEHGVSFCLSVPFLLEHGGG